MGIKRTVAAIDAELEALLATQPRDPKWVKGYLSPIPERQRRAMERYEALMVELRPRLAAWHAEHDQRHAALRAERNAAWRAERAKAAARRRAEAPGAKVRAYVLQWLRRLDFSREHTSGRSGYYYWRVGNKDLTVRVSDHQVPMSEERSWNESQGGRTWANTWRSIVIDERSTCYAAARWLVQVRQHIRRLEEIYAQQREDRLAGIPRPQETA